MRIIKRLLRKFQRKKINDGYYIFKPDGVYYLRKKIEEADTASFVVMDQPYAKDKNNVYYHGNPIESADANSFKVLLNNYYQDYAVDKDAVYRGSERIENADPYNIILVNGVFVKDKERVYAFNKALHDIDPASYRPLSGSYVCDKNYVYQVRPFQYIPEGMLRLDQVDIATFDSIGKNDDYIKDKNHVYYQTRVIEGADPQSFELLTHGYAKDTAFVYRKGKKIAEVNPYSVEIISEEYIRDNVAVYKNGKKINDFTFDNPKIKLEKIHKIPVNFDAYNPRERNAGYTEELGNYDWFLRQYEIVSGINKEEIETNEHVRNNILRQGFHTSEIISYEKFIEFVVKNYIGWAPYAKGMPREKAGKLTFNFINSFLLCNPENALYIEYSGFSSVKEPYLISGIIGIFDFENNEFFELIMGGTD